MYDSIFYIMKGIDMFTVAGVSRNNGVIKVRFCSDKVLRIKNLQKQGDTDIDLIELPKPMTKPEACQFLLDQDQFVVKEFLAYRGEPLKRTTVQFEVQFEQIRFRLRVVRECRSNEFSRQTLLNQHKLSNSHVV